MKTKSKVLILFALISMSSLLNAQNLECFVIVPPEKALSNVKKIAILNFENFDKNPYYNTYGGNAFVNYLTAQLLDENRGIYTLPGGIFSNPKVGKSFIKSSGIKIFKIVEREQLSSILKEKNLSLDVSLNDNQAAEVGKVLGIDALLMGTIKHTYNSNRTIVKYPDGSSAYCTENICETEIFIKVVSVENAQIIATKTIKKVSSDKQWGKNESAVLGFEKLAEINLKALAFEASCFITPFYVYYKADFRKIKTKEYKDKVSDIKKLIENEDLNSLYTIYKAIYDADNYNVEAAYNLALLSVITGDYISGANWDKIVYEIDSKEFGKANEWAKSWETSANSLKYLGVEIDKYNFDSKGSTDALANKIKTKGSKSDRFEVFEKTDKNSQVLAKVPGETEFVVIEKSGDFTKIKLLGGKEGYISNDNVKK